MCAFDPETFVKVRDCARCECPQSLLRHRPDTNGICSGCGQRQL